MTNDPSLSCPECGAVLDSRRLEGLCPACTWNAFAAQAPDAPAPEPALLEASGLMRLPGHLLEQELARGGMGVVYRARQLEPNREVALKMLLPHQLGSGEVRERFRTEARAIASLEHPGILPVYQVGEHEGMPFFTMKLAGAGSLAARAAFYHGNHRQIAELIAAVADAVQFAHEHGVLHRDLKPGNILFDEAGRPYVSDFGLAKLVSADSELTRSADVLGTPHYLAPEVAAASARQATTASDVYSLGAVLYELLCGHPPFQAEGIPALLRKIAEEEPLPLAEIPRDLGVITLKCLAKEPARRYGSARDLAEDLRRWLAGAPISARPASRGERVWSWARRNPLLALTAAALALSLAGGGLALWNSYRQVQSALTVTRDARNEAQRNLRDSLLAQAQALGAAKNMGQRWRALEALHQAATIAPSLELRNAAAAALARPDMREVLRFPAPISGGGSPAVFTSDLARYIAPEMSGGFALRATTNQALLAAFPGSLARPARWFVLSPDDQHVAALLDDYSMEIWRLGAAEPLLRWAGTIRQPPVVEFHPNGTALAAFVPGQGVFVQNFDGRGRKSLVSTSARAIYLRFDPSGERLAVVRDPGGVELWRCAKEPELLWSQPMRVTVPWVAWSPDGLQLAAAADDGRGLRLFSAGDGQVELTYSRHLAYPRQFEFSPTGHTIASIGQDWALRLWDARSGQDLVEAGGRHRVMRFSGDGRRLTTAPTDRDIAVLELAPEGIFHEFSSSAAGSEISCHGLACSADGEFLLTLWPQFRIYHTKAGRELALMDAPLAGSRETGIFETSGKRIVYSRPGKGIFRREVELATNQLSGALEVRWGTEICAAPQPNAVLWNTTQDGRAWVFDTPEGLEIWPNGDNAQRCAVKTSGLMVQTVSQNGRWAVGVDQPQQKIIVWDLASGLVATNLAARGPSRAWFSPDSKWLAVSIEPGYATWSTADWVPGPRWDAHLDSGDPGELSFSSDSRLLAARHEREIFKLFSFPACAELMTLKPPLVLPVGSACLSPDGTRLWLLANGYRLFEWNLKALRSELAALHLDW